MNKIINTIGKTKVEYHIISSADNYEQCGGMLCDDITENNTNKNEQDELETDEEDVARIRHKTKKLNRFLSWPSSKKIAQDKDRENSPDMHPNNICVSETALSYLRENSIFKRQSSRSIVRDSQEKEILIQKHRGDNVSEKTENEATTDIRVTENDSFSNTNSAFADTTKDLDSEKITSSNTSSTNDMHANKREELKHTTCTSSDRDKEHTYCCPRQICCCTKKKWLITILAICVVLIITVSISVKTTRRNQLTQSSSLTIEQQSEICLLHHMPVTYNQTSNPLGDKCRNGSNYVQQLCRKDASHHNCNECPDGELLPTVCFCDVGHQCPNAADAARKHTCYDCQKHCPCLNNGTCSCIGQQLTGEDLVCSCPAGYGGRYCEIVLVRICKKETRKTIQIEHCETSRTDDCYIYSQITKSNLTCTMFKDVTGWTDFSNCSHPYT